VRRLLSGLTIALLLPGCELPFGLGLPTTRDLENGALARLGSAKSLEVAGSYEDSSGRWDLDVQITRPGAEHIVASKNGVPIEAILLGKDGYFRGQELLAQQLNGDEPSRSLARAAGNGWWKGLLPAVGPDLSDFTASARVKSTFVNADVVTRRDHIAVNRIETAELSLPRADLYIREVAPHDLIRLQMRPGTLVGGMAKADLVFSHYGTDFKIVAPPSVINFADLSTLPPNYTVLSVDASGCGTPCTVNAALKNLGGKTGAKAPSTVALVMTDLNSGGMIGTCTATVVPDVDYNATTTVSCTIAKPAGQDGPGKVTATPTNPGHG
jgi:hypothetical protein